MRCRAWCVVVLAVGTIQASAHAYRGLAGCPGLRPFEPVVSTGREARRCERTLARAGGRFAARTLAATAACLERWQAGGLGGNAIDKCVGRTVLASGERIDPTHAPTAEAVAAARARARKKIARACEGVQGVTIHACDATGPALARCVLADHAEHLDHVLDEVYGDVQPVADPATRRCQRGLADATRGYVSAVQRAFSKCLASRRAASPVGPECLGTVGDGIIRPPADEATADTLELARGRFAQRVSRACPAEALAASTGARPT